MLNCREIAQNSSDFLDRALPWHARLQVRLHLMMCRFCREYVRQLSLVVRALGRIPRDEAPPAIEKALLAAFRSERWRRCDELQDMNHSPLWYFEHFGLLHGLSEQQKQQVEKQTRMVHVKRGQPVYLAGDPADHVYVVKSGAVKIVGKSPEGCEVILALLTPGDIFGELALTDDDEREDHRAEATEDTLVCEVPRKVLVQMIQDAPAFSRQITKLIGLRLRTLRSRVEELLGKSAPARLAHAITELSKHHGIRDGEGILIPLRLSQGDLGKLVGLTRETVNGIFQVWRAQGVAEMDRRSIRVRDPERLQRVR